MDGIFVFPYKLALCHALFFPSKSGRDRSQPWEHMRHGAVSVRTLAPGKTNEAVAFKVLENLKNASQIAKSSLMPNEALIPNQGEPS